MRCTGKIAPPDENLLNAHSQHRQNFSYGPGTSNFWTLVAYFVKWTHFSKANFRLKWNLLGLWKAGLLPVPIRALNVVCQLVNTQCCVFGVLILKPLKTALPDQIILSHISSYLSVRHCFRSVKKYRTKTARGRKLLVTSGMVCSSVWRITAIKESPENQWHSNSY